MALYYGLDMLQYLQTHYEPRLALALERGFDDEKSKYHWLFSELETRVNTLRRSMAFLSVLPLFIKERTAEQALTLILSFGRDWFGEESLGRLARDVRGNCSYFSNGNPYWKAFMEISDEIGEKEEQSSQVELYVDLTEYMVRLLLLYFYVRDKQFKSIDRGGFESLANAAVVLRQKSA